MNYKIISSNEQLRLSFLMAVGNYVSLNDVSEEFKKLHIALFDNNAITEDQIIECINILPDHEKTSFIEFLNAICNIGLSVFNNKELTIQLTRIQALVKNSQNSIKNELISKIDKLLNDDDRKIIAIHFLAKAMIISQTLYALKTGGIDKVIRYLSLEEIQIDLPVCFYEDTLQKLYEMLGISR
ncbi:MAG: hypothetical protein A2Y40_07115 [Candidatus Margulisbacteria bacterium GWF2_35_9]|nr:MAG: hypothetical protein A2Y40_07115 [Candidatus Margulisbacteria bacterium GWF2_35_9]